MAVTVPKTRRRTGGPNPGRGTFTTPADMFSPSKIFTTPSGGKQTGLMSTPALQGLAGLFTTPADQGAAGTFTTPVDEIMRAIMNAGGKHPLTHQIPTFPPADQGVPAPEQWQPWHDDPAHNTIDALMARKVIRRAEQLKLELARAHDLIEAFSLHIPGKVLGQIWSDEWVDDMDPNVQPDRPLFGPPHKTGR